MKDTRYGEFVKRWEQAMELPPQNMGPLTPYYKRAAGRLKVMPWPAMGAAAVVVGILLYGLFGSAIAFLTTILQRGF